MNDRWHTAVHEAGHAVIGRVLNMTCGHVTIVADEDSAGHSITDDPWAIMYAWERRGRFREASTIFRSRILTTMAGGEAEVVIIGDCEGGDVDDRYQVALMLESEAGRVGDDLVQLEDRLRRTARMLVRRHASKIRALADALMERDTINSDSEIRIAAGLAPAPADFDYWATLGFGDVVDGPPIHCDQ